MKKLFVAALAVVSQFVFGATLVPIQLLNPSGSSSGQAIVSTGSGSAPAWGGVGVNGIASIAANTVLANATGSSASPTAFAMPSCSTTNSALQYTSGTGFTCVTNSAVTTGTLAQFAATTSAQLASVLSDETGSGFAVFSSGATVTGYTITTSNINSTPIGGTTPNSGAFTTLSASGLITPSTTNGIKGTTAADNANSGSDGEVISATVSAVNVTTSNTNQNLTSISLTAGDWDVVGFIGYTSGTGATSTAQVAGISTTSATLPAVGQYWQSQVSTPATGVGSCYVPATRINVSSTTTVYLVGLVTFSGGAVTANGFIQARRIR